MPRFERISLIPLALGILLTAGLLMYPWCWTQWRYYRKHSAADVSPLLRAFFYPLFLPALTLLLPTTTSAERRWRDSLSLLSLVLILIELSLFMAAILSANLTEVFMLRCVITLLLVLIWQWRVNASWYEERGGDEYPSS